jgi:hypothetical protein
MIHWSAGSGLLIGLLIDAQLIGRWMLFWTAAPVLAPRSFPRWATAGAVFVLVAISLAACVLGYLEGRLKLD